MGSEEVKKFQFQYGFVLLRTKRFQRVMDRLGASRISRPVGWVLLYAMPVAAAIAFYLFLTELAVLLSPRGAEVASFVRTLGPLANFALPGINPYLPIVDGWIALLVAMVVHEGAHGIVARSLGIPVKASGLIFFLIVPIGAFVDVDESAMRQAKLSYSGRVLAAGAGVNLFVGLACLLLLVLTVGAMVPAASGAGIVSVAANSPASNAGIRSGDIVTQIDGQNITDMGSVIGPNTSLHAGQYVNLTVYRGGQTLHFSVQLACCYVEENLVTKQNTTYPYIGIQQMASGGLVAAVSNYVSPLSNPWQYVCIPTLPTCQTRVPFSDVMGPFYTSPLGSASVPLSNLFYWLFFLNFSLAIFNALPIYPLDGGQAFSVGLRALARGKLAETTLSRMTALATFAVLAILFGVIAGPYLF